ncbi:peptidase S8/S53 domain-containing protein [Mycena galericulata]|nr:peptidase S8/S53 domain-containing protein [Mycena galericulata]
MLFLTALLLSILSPRWTAAQILHIDPPDFVVKHSWGSVPRGWTFHSWPSKSHPLNVYIGYKQSGVDDMISSLYEISDPYHTRYGQHMSKAELASIVKPQAASVEAVASWLREHNVDYGDNITSSSESGWLNIRVSLAEAERMLNTTYARYYHSRSKTYAIRTLAYSLPHDLYSHVDVVAPTTYFGNPQLESGVLKRPFISMSQLSVPQECGMIVTPACLRALYRTSSYIPSATSINQLGVTGYLGQYANDADLQTFLQQFRPDAVGATVAHVQINGGLNNQSDPGLEANVDVQVTEGISFPTPITFYSTGGSPPFLPDPNTPSDTNEPYLDWLTFILSQENIPQTITTSYDDIEQTVPEEYAVKVCNLFAQLGLRGSSLLFASGDFGVGEGDCLTNDGTNRQIFQPVFPASCPFVTAVGGTTGINPEIAVNYSGGGFSRYFPLPSYQSSAVSNFLSEIGSEFSGLFNKQGRGYPDVSAAANGYEVVFSGITGLTGGTSASTPTVAGIISLLNDFRLANEKPALGFLNPLIYAKAISGFNDIILGSNPGCSQPYVVFRHYTLVSTYKASSSGFAARKGWDPVTGLGTPDFLRLQKLIGDV